MIRAVLVAAVALLLALFASPARAGLPTAINDLQRCQTFAQQVQSGNYPADTCAPDTLSTIKRCTAQGVQFGAISQADADSLIANLELYCRLQQG